MKPFFITFFLSLFLSLLSLSLSNSSFITTRDNKFYINNTQILFKGVNVVYKEYPYYPNMNKFTLNDSLVEEDFKILHNNGINCIRLGVMMGGVIPQENYINQTYLNKITEIINLGSKYDIYFLLDFHQDLLSELFCGEGIPDWLNYKLLDNKTINDFPFPLLDKKCDENNWIKYHFSRAVSKLFQKLYENPKYLELYWNVLALSFKDNKNVIGYELINEPWFGDIYQNPLYFSPSYSYKYNLLPFYNKLISYITKYDNNHLIFFETPTIDIFESSLYKLPNITNDKLVFSFHGYFPPNINNKQLFNYKLKTCKKYNISCFLTEFSLSSGDYNKKQESQIIDFMKYLMNNQLSHILWEYKSYAEITGFNTGFFNQTGILNYGIKNYTFPYFQRIDGSIKNIDYDINNEQGYLNITISTELNTKEIQLFLNNYEYNVETNCSLQYKKYNNKLFFNEINDICQINILLF